MIDELARGVMGRVHELGGAQLLALAQGLRAARHSPSSLLLDALAARAEVTRVRVYVYSHVLMYVCNFGVSGSAVMHGMIHTLPFSVNTVHILHSLATCVAIPFTSHGVQPASCRRTSCLHLLQAVV